MESTTSINELPNELNYTDLLCSNFIIKNKFNHLGIYCDEFENPINSTDKNGDTINIVKSQKNELYILNRSEMQKNFASMFENPIIRTL